MHRRIRWALVIVAIGILFFAWRHWGNRLPGEFSDEVGTARYDCTLTLLPARDLADSSTVRATLEWENRQSCTRLDISRHSIVITAIAPHQPKQNWLVVSEAIPGTPYKLTIMRRGGWLSLLRENQVLFHAAVPHPAGCKAGITAEKGWTIDDLRVQRLEAVSFADNFMRSSSEGTGAWTIRSGKWGLASAWEGDPRGNAHDFINVVFAQNPFAWRGHGTPAICTTGSDAWEDYTLSAAVQPAARGAVGLLVNRQEDGTALLLRWSPVNDRGLKGGQLVLYRLAGKSRTVLASSPGGYLPGQWYRLSVITGVQEVRVVVDGRERLVAKNITPWRGGIGLYTEGKRGATFDDVTAYGHTLNTDLLAENGLRQLGERIREDKDMRKWANDWEAFSGALNAYLHKGEFYGDSRLSVYMTPEGNRSGELCLVLNGNGQDLNTGYRAVIRRAYGGKVKYLLYAGTKQLQAQQGELLSADEEYALQLRHEGGRLQLDLDGATVASAPAPDGAPGRRIAYQATGCFAKSHEAVALGRNVLDYLFTDAPVDWVSEGAWASTVRWACDARWSFLSGWSHGDAVLWHKQRFAGDQSFDAVLAPKMEYPDARVLYAERYCRMGITICGDGHNPRTGYAAIFGAPDAAGNPNRRTVLLRQGVVVAEIGLFLPPKDEVHKQWSHLRLNKHGSTVELWVDQRQVLTYTDPHPIDSGVPAVWTTDNGLSLARARLQFARAPQPRTDDQLFLDAPAAPAWQNTGTPLTLGFPNSCSSTRQPVRLQVVPRETPPGESSPVVGGRQVTFTPRKVGVHWYRISATDGTNRSPSYHLLLPVFNPSLGRDNSHALVLYYFDEGRGQRVKDHGSTTPPLDLHITDERAVRWQTGRGLALQRPTLLKSSAGARKLQTIASQRACTIECWVSFATLYPPTTPPVFWEGNLCSWGNGAAGRNLSFGFHSFSLVVGAIPGSDLQKFNGRNCWTPHNHIGLQHQVITWTGSSTRFYVNGRKVDEKPYQWQPETWNPDLPLLLGNEPDMQRPFLGTYYLLAIHDNALSDAQVLRHYQAGPSAK
ncbi:MAG: LamG-like jellyroll fold domain-containing protein [Armatimonadota bacterium]